MAVRIAGFPVWVGPTELIGAARSVLGWTDDMVGVLADLPCRAAALLDEAEGLVRNLGALTERADALLERTASLVWQVDNALDQVRSIAGDADALVEQVRPVAGNAAALIARVEGTAGDAAALVNRAGDVADGARRIVDGAGTVADRAAQVVDEAAAASQDVTRMLGTYAPIAERAAPLARRFVEETSEDEVQAAIKLIDQLPALTEHLESDIMPILATLDRVGPDVHELLEQLKEVRAAIQGIPGFGYFRRRGERDE